MKTNPIFNLIFFAAMALAVLINCSGSQNEDATTSHSNNGSDNAAGDASVKSAEMEAADPQFQVDQRFQKQLGNAFTSYVSLKDALVSSDTEKVKTEASATKEALARVDMTLLSGAAHHDWMNHQAPMENSLTAIASASDIDAQRESFRSLSDHLYKSIKAFGLGGKEAYYEFCPMAFNNEEGYWLSDQDEIRNPYYGETMLTCGEVKEKLK